MGTQAHKVLCTHRREQISYSLRQAPAHSSGTVPSWCILPERELLLHHSLGYLHKYEVLLHSVLFWNLQKELDLSWHAPSHPQNALQPRFLYGLVPSRIWNESGNTTKHLIVNPVILRKVIMQILAQILIYFKVILKSLEDPKITASFCVLCMI